MTLVVGGTALANQYGAASRIDTGNGAENHVRVCLAREDAADWRRDVGRRQGGRGDLVEQRLEQVIVAAINDRDIGVNPGEPCRHRKATKPCTDNDDTRPPGPRVRPIGMLRYFQPFDETIHRFSAPSVIADAAPSATTASAPATRPSAIRRPSRSAARPMTGGPNRKPQ